RRTNRNPIFLVTSHRCRAPPIRSPLDKSTLRAIIAHQVSNMQKTLPRLLEATLSDRLKRSPVVVLTGARQTGKTTLVQALPEAANRRFVTLDRLTALDLARREPEPLVASAPRMT